MRLLATDMVYINGDAVRDCNRCDCWRGMSNRKYSGVRVPDGSGKCCRPGGHCNPHTVRGKIRGFR